MPIGSVINDGFIILDKPAGLTSRAVVDDVKRLLGVKVAGHVGTLDPGATGVLPILFGRATLAARALERSDKEYVAVIHMHKPVEDEELKSVISAFVGQIKQTPPVKSAVARHERIRHVYSIDIIGREGNDVQMRIVCEAGTYIRKLASDMGDIIGGAHLKGLRRTRSGPFTEADAHTVEELQVSVQNESMLKKIILPTERLVAHISSVVVKDSTIPAVMHGSPIPTSGVVSAKGLVKGELVAVLSTSGELIALGYAMIEDVTKKGMVAVQIDRVIKA